MPAGAPGRTGCAASRTSGGARGDEFGNAQAARRGIDAGETLEIAIGLDQIGNLRHFDRARLGRNFLRVAGCGLDSGAEVWHASERYPLQTSDLKKKRNCVSVSG